MSFSVTLPSKPERCNISARLSFSRVYSTRYPGEQRLINIPKARTDKAERGDKPLSLLIRVGCISGVTELGQVISNLTVDALGFLNQAVELVGLACRRVHRSCLTLLAREPTRLVDLR